MRIDFPQEREAWDNYVEWLLTELRADYAKLWRNLPQLPDPEAGIPYTGPLVPVPFCWPFQECARETHEPCGQECYRISVSASRATFSGTIGCQDCHLLDGTFDLQQTSGASGAAQCNWSGDFINFVNCGSVSFQFRLQYIRATGKWTLFLFGFAGLNGTGGSGIVAQWTYNGLPLGGNQAFPITLNTAGGSGTQVVFTVGADGNKACNLSSNVTVDLCP